METMTWNEYLDFLEERATTKSELESIKRLRGEDTRIEYSLTSGRSGNGSLYETFKNKENFLKRIEYIETHKEEFQYQGQIWARENFWNSRDKIIKSHTIKVIETK